MNAIDNLLLSAAISFFQDTDLQDIIEICKPCNDVVEDVTAEVEFVDELEFIDELEQVEQATLDRLDMLCQEIDTRLDMVHPDHEIASEALLRFLDGFCDEADYQDIAV